MTTTCPKCNATMQPERAGSLVLKCDNTQCRHRVLHKPEDTVSIRRQWLQERQLVLDANKSNLNSRLLAVETPASVLEHCEALEKRACEIFDQAQRMRASLVDDTENKVSILSEWVAADKEMMLCELLLRVGDDITPQRYDRLLRGILKCSGG